MEIIGLDFETYSGAPLPTCGLENYVRDPHFKPLIGAIDTGLLFNLDFVTEPRTSMKLLSRLVEGNAYFAVHNAGFERRVMKALGFDLPDSRFIDSAVIARVAGAGSSLEASSAQLLGNDKIEDGMRLIRLFSIPGSYQEKQGHNAFDPNIFDDNPEDVIKFFQYCRQDARLSRELVLQYKGVLSPRELEYELLTAKMNQRGWTVDLEALAFMRDRYQENLDNLLLEFRENTGEETIELPNGTIIEGLNLNSQPQLKAWCKARGINANSFDEKHVASLIKKIHEKLASGTTAPDKQEQYSEVLRMLQLKQELGGSSLKKLKVIAENVTPDGQLLDQYVHAGASQTLRTTGRSVQMQNLKRLATPLHMDSLSDPNVHWNNTELAENLRQLFTSSRVDGELIVGDFSSVESRGLAYQAREDWKILAYRRGEDLYKVLAQKIFDVTYDEVTKAQRTTGKVAELSCGYCAGGDAVESFAEGMGVKFQGGEAARLVRDWREANPKTVEYWSSLDVALRHGLDLDPRTMTVIPMGSHGMELRVAGEPAPTSLQLQDTRATSSLRLYVVNAQGGAMFSRIFHGVHEVGGEIRYFKPSARKTGDLWNSTFTHPKTGQQVPYKIYGGKLAGILTQSLCREIFFEVLAKVDEWVAQHDNIELVGQFHDEIVLDWWPASTGISKGAAIAKLRLLMSECSIPGFPLAAEVHSDYRYIK